MTLDGVQEIATAPAAPLRVTEMMYNPPGSADVNGDENEFIELQNTGTSALNLTGYKFSAGVDFTFGNLTLAPGAKTVVVKNLQRSRRATAPRSKSPANTATPRQQRRAHSSRR